MTETSEDKLVRYLTRVSFGEMDRTIQEFLKNPLIWHHSDATKIYRSRGWRREEYLREVKRDAE